MKTKLPPDIMTVQEAKNFLSELHKNDESFHPEDSAHNIIWSTVKPTKKEKDQLDRLMSDIYALGGFDPCEYILTLINGRENGFYWVKCDAKWFVAYYSPTSNTWLHGSTEIEGVTEIDETRLLDPSERT